MPRESVIIKWVEEHGIRRPYVRVVLRYRKAEQGAVMLIDTGADSCILPNRYIDLLGIRRDDLRSTSAAGLSGKTGILVGKKRIRLTAELENYFSIQMPVEFAANDQIPPILGRDALFGDFELRMSRREIELIRVP